MDSTRIAIRESVAKSLGLCHDVEISTVDSGDHTLITLVNLGDIVEDRERVQDSFLYLSENATPEWRRITMNPAISQVAVNRTFDVDPSGGDGAEIYMGLNPTEWNDAINDVLRKLYFHIRDEITIVEGQRQYSLASWVQSKGQAVDFRYRNLTTFQEIALPRYRLDETANAVTLHLLDDPWQSTQWSIIAECKKFYTPLTTDTTSNPSVGDDDTGVTTCPEQLWQPAVKAGAIHKMMLKYGDRLGKKYAQDLAIAEREYLKARAEILPTLVAREYNQDEDWGGWPDIDYFFLSSGWGSSRTGWI